MKLRPVLLGIVTIASLVQGTAMAGSYDPLEIRLHPDVPEIATIKVDGNPDGSYTKILTTILEYGVYVRGDRPTVFVPGSSRLVFHFSGDEVHVTPPTEEWERHTLAWPYSDPMRNSPIKLCNDRMRNSSGAARQEFLTKGKMFLYEEAYRPLGSLHWDMHPGYPMSATEWLTVPVRIKCLGLNRNRKDDNGPQRTTKPSPPLFWQTTLKIEPAKMVRDGRYMCPSELKLYGFVESGRKFQGKAIFMGPHYLSAITPLNFSYAGSRNMTATYPVKWKEIGGLTTTSDPKPKKQKLTFRFNISGQDGKLLESVEETLEVSCGKIEVNMPAGLTGN